VDRGKSVIELQGDAIIYIAGLLYRLDYYDWDEYRSIERAMCDLALCIWERENGLLYDS